MTEAEYIQKIGEWAVKVSSMMKGNLRSGTSGTGYSSKSLKVNVKETRTGGHSIGFSFAKYGVFVHYGVGRGWVRQGNTVVRGSKVKKKSEIWHQLKKRGYSTKELSNAITQTHQPPSTPIKPHTNKQRKPVDWFDSVLKAHINELADIAAEFYGEYSLEKLEEMLSRMTITKKKDE